MHDRRAACRSRSARSASARSATSSPRSKSCRSVPAPDCSCCSPWSRSPGAAAELAPRYIGFHLARNTTHFVGQFSWALAVTLLPFATVFALEFTTPAWVALLAALILGERMTKSRAGSVVLGFLGVLVIVRPGLKLSAEGAAGAVRRLHLCDLADRHQATDQPRQHLRLGCWMNLMQLPMALAWPSVVAATEVLAVRVPPRRRPGLPALALAAAGLTSHYCLTQAFRFGDATVVVPLDFVRIPLIALRGLDVLRRGA